MPPGDAALKAPLKAERPSRAPARADELYRIAFEGASDLLALIRVAPGGIFHVEHMNASAVEFFARALPEVSHVDWLQLDMATMFRDKARFTPAQVDEALIPHREAVRTGNPVTVTSEVCTATGQRLARKLTMTPIADARGRVTHLLYRAMDLTGLRSAEERFERLFDISPVPLSIVRLADGVRQEANAAWLAFHGRTREQAISQTDPARTAWADPAVRARMIDALRRDGHVPGRLVQLVAAGGVVKDAVVSMARIVWEGDACMVVATLDVSELNAVRRDAQTSSERFKALFRLSPNPSSVTTLLEGRYLALNEAWAGALGYAPEEMLDRRALDLGIWPDEGERTRFVGELNARGALRQLPVRFRTRGGEIRQMLISSELIDWGGVRAILSSMNDVTDLTRAGEEIRDLNESLEQKVRVRTGELEAANRELEAANRELESFSYSVSHDLRSPLGAINGFAHVLREQESGRLSADGDRLLGLLERDAERMALLVDGLLDFSRLGRKPVTKSAVVMAELAASVADELRGKRDARRAEIRIGAIPACSGDPVLLRQVWWNLLDNALKYSRQRERALIEVGYDPDAGAYRVRDNGVGFDMRHATKLFGVFERLHADSEFEGTGIGLANAARIVLRHGGRIWCEALPGQGATFYFSLPA